MFEQELLAERARLTPDKTAIVSAESGERLTYAQLDERACRFAEMLRRNGVGPGDRFGILAYNSIDYVALFFAAGKADAIVVPLSTRATQHELQQIVNDCGMKWLWHDDDFASMPLSLPGGDAAPRSGTAEDIDCLLYTSGTTGKPKGVMIPRRQLYWNGVNTAISWGLRDDDVSTVHTPLYHAGGIAAFLIPIFTAGGTMVVHKTFNASAVWRTIERERATVVLGVPTIWKLMMEAPEFATANLEHVRWFISGGAPLPVYIAEAYAKRGVAMKQGYGLTEVGVNCFSMTVEESVRKRGTIGKPMLFTDVRLVDGEMHIRGPHVSLGYWNDEEATRAAFGEDGWFRTGDLARVDDEGFFTIIGRRKEMFITGGVNVYPAEIEAELVAHPEVVDAAVIPVPDETWGESGVAFVVSKATEDDLASFLALRLAKYKVPKRFVFIDALPRTPYGKVEKGKLRDML
jgi:fatty-acyl-CoA synthase